MEFIGNYKDWIVENSIIEMLENKQGDTTPVWQPERLLYNVPLRWIGGEIQP